MNVDWDRINSLISEDDPEELEWLKEMLTSLLENFEERLGELDILIASPEQAKLASLLHQMKGVTANFGLESLRSKIVTAEGHAKNNQINEAINISKELRSIWQETRKELKSKMNI